MKHPFLIVCFLFLCSLSATGQNLQLIDSLKTSLKSAEGKNRFDLLNDLAWEYRWATPDSTFYYAKQAYALGKQLKLRSGLAEPLNFIGVAHNYKGERLLAFEHYESALKVATNQKDTCQIAHSNNNLGRLFFEQGLLSRTYEYFIRALTMFEAVGDSSGLAYTYQSLAGLYKSQHDYKKAENHYKKAYKMRLLLGNTRDIMSALVQIGRLYQENNQHDQALLYLHRADSTGHVIQDKINLAEIKTLIALSYRHKGLLDDAEAMASIGLDVILKMNNVRMMPQAYLTMGQIKFSKNEFEQSKKYIHTAMQIASRTNDLDSKMEAHYWLWKLSEKQNDKNGQLLNHNQYLILKDSVKDLDLTRQVERLQFQMDIQRKEQENDLLKANQLKNDAFILKQKLQNLILIIIIGSISVLAIVQWRFSRKRREINKKLEEQNQFIQNQQKEIIDQNENLSRRNHQLFDLNHEKDTLMGIVAHDLKSPLNRIKGIINLMEFEGELSKNQIEYVQMTNDATQAGLDLIKDLLDVHMLEENVNPTFSTFDISAFMFEKIHSFSPTAESKSIHLHITRIESKEVTLDTGYLSRIVDNLISNAIKFSPKNSSVDVSAGKENSHVWISVKDYGPGFSEKDRLQLFQKFKKLSARPTAGETSNGLGLAIVKTLVDRLNGEIELISEPSKGSEFVIRFPTL